MASYGIESRQELIEYCMRALGAPVLKINIQEDQLEDRVNDALDMFFEYHFDGSYRSILTVILSADDIATQSVTLPYGIISVQQVALMAGGFNTTPLFSGNLQTYAYFSDLISKMQNDGLSSYVQTMSYLNMVDGILNGPGKVVQFNKHTDKLYIQMDWSSVKVGDAIGVECYQHPDIDSASKTFNNYWLKLYCTALIKKQWGTNLIKFQNLQLPGGGTLNGGQILQEAKEEIQTLEKRLQEEFREYPMPMMG